MTLQILFSLAGSLALAGWLVLAVTPYRYDLPRYTSAAIAAAIAMLYAALIAAFWTSADGGFGSLADVGRLFGHPGLLLAGWVHYLAFDLLVGLWEREQARRLDMPHWLLLPCLALTFLFGPLGWLLFMALRHFLLRTRASADPAAAAC